MEIRSTEEVMEKVYSYAEEILLLQIEKKEIDDKIKEIKADYKEEGIAVGLVSKILSKIKRDMKKSEGEVMEEEILTEKLEANEKITTMISSLN